VGFAWVVPGPQAAYVVVSRDSYAEAYAVTGEAPVRVTTSNVDLGSGSARFDVSEHTSAGRRIGARVVNAQVSG
jgi:hypothetical protein